MRLCTSPVDPWALDAQKDAKVDGGPARVGLPAVAALLVSRHALDPLQDVLSSGTALARLAGRIDAADGRGGCPVQMLKKNNNVQCIGRMLHNGKKAIRGEMWHASPQMKQSLIHIIT